MTALPSPPDCLHDLWNELGGEATELDDMVLTGLDPVLPSSFAVGLLAQVSIAAVALAARTLHRRRGGRRQQLRVDMLHAALECRSERLLRIDGRAPGELWDDLAGLYPCRGGRHVRLHTNFPHHRAGIVRLLGCQDKRAAVAEALLSWDGEEFETAATEAGMVVSFLRHFDEWDRHPHSVAIASQPLISLTKLGASKPTALKPGARPLDDLKVLETTRIIAAPVAGRALAAHGAEVLRLIGPNVPTIDSLDIDSGRGKRSAFLDLAAATGREAYLTLAASADIVINSYRPGVMEAFGCGAADLVARKPDLIIGNLSAYGRQGPWGGKRGFDSLVQAATGFNLAEGAAKGDGAPRVLPMQILDHATGYLLAFGVLMARLKQASEGGSWQVDVSLARTAHWLRSLGRMKNGLKSVEPAEASIDAILRRAPSGFGELTFPSHAGWLSETPPAWTLPSMPYGSSLAVWSEG